MTALPTIPKLPTLTARWERPAGRPVWGDYEYALVLTRDGRVTVWKAAETQSYSSGGQTA